MRKAVMAILLICVVSTATALALILSHNQNQTGEQTENYTVKIADFEWTSSWGAGPVGVMWGGSFNITLQNMGAKAIEGLSVDIKLLANNTEIPAETGLYGPGIIGYTAQYNGFDGKLNASETRELRGSFMTGLDKLDRAEGDKTFAVKVMMNGTVLDELPLPYT